MKILPILLLCPILSFADTITCKVVAITDGDTIICLADDKVQHKIRLYQIDAPERKQDFGTASRKALSDMVFNKAVEVKTHKKDKYRRTLGTIYRDNKDINLAMIRLGMAWYYPFTKKNDVYKQAEEKARDNKVGLWSQKAIAPWEFRKSK